MRGLRFHRLKNDPAFTLRFDGKRDLELTTGTNVAYDFRLHTAFALVALNPQKRATLNFEPKMPEQGVSNIVVRLPEERARGVEGEFVLVDHGDAFEDRFGAWGSHIATYGCASPGDIAAYFADDPVLCEHYPELDGDPYHCPDQ